MQRNDSKGEKESQEIITTSIEQKARQQIIHNNFIRKPYSE